MPRKRRSTTEQIITKLREADILLSQGKTAEEISRVLEISKQTYYPWHKDFDPEEIVDIGALRKL